ncbi:hypothetical protein DSM43518_02034 [Mycobacterium marinum]|uniref:terminase n=1 Tax=Mycobacterium marinum TaxID=1781 RepID=UPI000E3B690D|nr:terminase [Mycobacterium marinum]RFZ11194.1 hypothetical protein DSM43518_02034 [Mycobacterium marinum]
MTYSMTTATIESDQTEQYPAAPRTNRPWPRKWPDFLGKWPRLTGRQQPAIEVWHPGDESEGDRTARFGVRIGLRPMPWEWMIIRAIMSLLPVNGWGIRLWTHRVVVIECTRQQGKTLILILVILRRLFKHRRRVVYTAQQWATVEDVFDRVCAIIDRVPSLKSRLAAPPSKKDNRGVIRLRPLPGEKHVVKADFGPRTQHFARGFTEIDDLILDEAYDLVPKETANLTGAQAASSNPQTIYASTPPVKDEHPNCHRFAGLIRTIVAGGARGLYGVLYRAPKRFTRGDPAAYPLAQPSYGVVGDDREMEAHLQGAQDAGPADLALFDADWMGWGDYPPPSNRRESEIPAQGWNDMQAKSAPDLIGSPAIGLHLDSGTWAITAAWYTTEGLAHLEVGYSRLAASVEVVEAVIDLVSSWNPVAVVIKSGSESAAIEPELIKAGVEPVMVNRTEWSQWCGGFLNWAKDSRFSHCGQRTLNAAAGSAVRRELPAGGFVWDEDAAAGAAPALVSATLAHGALLAHGGLPRRKTVSPRTAARRVSRRHTDLDPMKAAF